MRVRARAPGKLLEHVDRLARSLACLFASTRAPQDGGEAGERLALLEPVSDFAIAGGSPSKRIYGLVSLVRQVALA